MTSIWDTAADIRRAFINKSLSPVEFLKELLDRIERYDPALNIFVHLDPELALNAARQAEREMSAGKIRGPLHGIPVGIKDMIDVAGMPTTCHSKILLGNIAREDAAAVERLRNGGAILLGKVATHEFGMGGPSFDLPFPPARNPWNRDHHPGGSSSGSAAGVAAGFFPVALGTDAGGSIRHPASACGVAGLKPTYELVSRRGAFPASPTADHVGPLARSVEDIAISLGVVAEQGRAPGSDQDDMRYCRLLDKGVRGLRIGFVRHFHETDMPADADVGAALEEVVRVLEGEGADVIDVSLPPLATFAGTNGVIVRSESWTCYAHLLRTRPQDFSQLSRQRLMTGAFLSAEDYVQALHNRLKLIAAVEAVFSDVDILLSASSMHTASRIDDPAETTRTYFRQARTPFNLTGHPAISMLSGFSEQGLPLSAQFVGKYFGEAELFRVAAAYERAAGWNKRHPTIAALTRNAA